MPQDPMGFVRPDRPDIFVSYAHVNDRPPPGTDRGWVTTLVGYLQDLLAERLGRSEVFRLWQDHELSRHLALTPQIEGQVREAAVLLVVLSEGYLESEWCQKEMRIFREEVRRRTDAGSRVFVVRYEPVEEEKCPELRDLIGYRFYTEGRGPGDEPHRLGHPRPDPKEKDYYTLVNNLARDLAKELRRLKASRDPGPLAPRPGPVDRRETIYLAEVTDDLDPLREEVKVYLEQQGLRVLPEIQYPRDEAGVRAELDRAGLFVQLLSEVPGKRLPGSGKSCVGLQSDCARAHGIPRLLWRSREAVPSGVADPAHRELLDSPEVVVEDLLEFKRQVVRRARELSLAPPASNTDLENFVFIDANGSPSDQELLREISEYLARQGLGSIPALAGDQSDLADRYLELTLPRCDGMLLLYGDDPIWLVQHAFQFHELPSTHKARLRAIGLCDGPPPKKPQCHLYLVQGQHFINCRNGLSEESFAAFIAACKGGPSP